MTVLWNCWPRCLLVVVCSMAKLLCDIKNKDLLGHGVGEVCVGRLLLYSQHHRGEMRVKTL